MSTPTADKFGNVKATEGCDRCICGSKYWERDICVSCGAPYVLTATLYGGVYRGTPSRPNANPILAAMRDDFGDGDNWGTAMAWAFGVADYLHHVALAEVPAECGYRPAATVRGDGFDDESYPDAYIVEMGLDTFTLTQAAKCLARYTAWLDAAGQSY